MWKYKYTANCLPLEKICVLNTQMARTEDIINSRTGLNSITIPNDNVAVSLSQIDSEDFDFVSTMPWIPEDTESVIKSIIEYNISRCVVKKVARKIKCEPCVAALYGEVIEVSLIYMKDIAGLIYSSEDVIGIAIESERLFRKTMKFKNVNENMFRKLVNQCLVTSKNFFNILDIHIV